MLNRNGGDEAPLCSLHVVVGAQEGCQRGCFRVVATPRHGSGRAGASSSHGRRVVRSGDRIAPAGPGLRRDRAPSALGTGVTVFVVVIIWSQWRANEMD